MRHKIALGFTFIEILLLVILLALVSAIAWRSYNLHLIAKQRHGLTIHLAAVANYVERYVLDHQALPALAQLEALELVNYPDATKLSYKISLEGSEDNYRLIATPQGAMVNDSCGVFQIDYLGRKFANRPDCW